MREAAVTDYWRRARKRKYKNELIRIDFNGLNNIPALNIPNGILAICGLNGAGKSTILSAIKAVIGWPLSRLDNQRIAGNTVSGAATCGETTINCSNQDDKHLTDQGWNLSNIAFIDYSTSTDAQLFFIKQDNLEELLEQYEESELNPRELSEINYLVGKNYTSCSVIELTDLDEADATIPYFKVEVNDTTYTSQNMGTGEHFLFFLFWKLRELEEDSLLILEEPETFISVPSQVYVINHLGKKMAEHGLKVILTTHSPYILENIQDENIRIVSRMGNNVSIIRPDTHTSAESILGIQERKVGTYFVEDRVAADYLSAILEDKNPALLKRYFIDWTGGESNITDRLNFPKSDKISYKFIGVYDGDMKERLDSTGLNWPFCFLPGKQAPEALFHTILSKPENINCIAKCYGRDPGAIIAVLAKIDGLDCHDWFEELRKYFSVDGKNLVGTIYREFMKDLPEVNAFIDELAHLSEM